MEVEENKKMIKYRKIDVACNNFKSISNSILNPKFTYIDSWIYNLSKTFKMENKNDVQKTYPRFSYGTIVKVDFGINVGTEISGPHFAIVLNKYDSVKHGSVTVLPLTSKYSPLNLPLNELIIDEFTKRVNKGIEILIKDIENIKKIKNERIFEESERKSKELHELQDMFEYYSNYAKNSYACMDQITTISKSKILVPKNKYDIIGRAKCSSNTMKYISLEITKCFTNFYNKT